MHSCLFTYMTCLFHVRGAATVGGPGMRLMLQLSFSYSRGAGDEVNVAAVL